MSDFCVKTADILLPAENIDLNKWAVVACDQFTSEPEYWQQLKDYIGEAPSALKVVLPEAYLNDAENLTSSISAKTTEYLATGIFKNHPDSIFYIERSTPYTEYSRKGIVCAIDLESYSFYDSDKALIRATEGTVLSRIPPRVKIREKAAIEFPHVMLLADDREDDIFKCVTDSKKEQIYDFELNMGGGSIKGYKLLETNKILDVFKSLIKEENLIKKYCCNERLLFAVGDGNHSLATAKTCWNNIKNTLSAEDAKNHPARYALVEIVNIHDKALTFEPIHRYIFGIDTDKFYKEFFEKFKSEEFGEGVLICNDKKINFKLAKNAAQAVYDVQSFLDDYVLKNGGEVDYIHGDKSLENIVEKSGGAGILLPTLKKEDLFDYVIKCGSLPRKSFSMGEASEKRYYIEGRKIKFK